MKFKHLELDCVRMGTDSNRILNSFGHLFDKFGFKFSMLGRCNLLGVNEFHDHVVGNLRLIRWNHMTGTEDSHEGEILEVVHGT